MQKEVFAHFGLAFMKMGLVEHSMINVITFQHVGERLRGRKIRTQADWEAAFDSGFAEAKALTFGNQSKLILAIPEFLDLETNFEEAKRLRNYFAHHFMREEAGYFGTDDGCWLLLFRIAEVRQVFLGLEEELQPRFHKMKERYQLPTPKERELDAMMSKYDEEYASALRNGTAKVGWDEDAL